MDAKVVERLQKSFQPVPPDALAGYRKALDAAFARPVFATPRFAEALSTIAIPTSAVVDVETGYDEVLRPALGDDAPDGIGAIPLVLGQISRERRRELIVRLAALVAFTALYLRALAIERAELEMYVGAMIATMYLYASVLNAVDEATRSLEADED